MTEKDLRHGTWHRPSRGRRNLAAAAPRWLHAPAITGWPALVIAIIAVAFPTLVRALLDEYVSGCEFTPYLPFVLLSAILLGNRHASAVALGSVSIFGSLFAGPLENVLGNPCFFWAAATFLAASAMVISLLAALRTGPDKRPAHEQPRGIIFSLEQGQVWASWLGGAPPVNLGSAERVGEMMEDFLAQVAVGKRLNRPR